MKVLCQPEAQMWEPALVRTQVQAQVQAQVRAQVRARVVLVRTVDHQTATQTRHPAMEMLVAIRAEAEMGTEVAVATMVEAALAMLEAIQDKKPASAMVRGLVLMPAPFMFQPKPLYFRAQ